MCRGRNFRLICPHFPHSKINGESSRKERNLWLATLDAREEKFSHPLVSFTVRDGRASYELTHTGANLLKIHVVFSIYTESIGRTLVTIPDHFDSEEFERPIYRLPTKISSTLSKYAFRKRHARTNARNAFPNGKE